MKARHITDSAETIVDAHFEHAVDAGVGYGQLWVSGPAGTWHLEFTRDGLKQLAKDAAELAAGL